MFQLIFRKYEDQDLWLDFFSQDLSEETSDTTKSTKDVAFAQVTRTEYVS